MTDNLQQWQRSMIRNNIEKYREALENYYIKNKRIVEVSSGKAFSLLSPPLGSPAARRRIRFIMNNAIDKSSKIDENGTIKWGSRTPHFLTIAVTYNCQCNCKHCSAYDYREDVKREKNALSFSELKRGIREAIDIGSTCIILTGGEPLIYEDIYKLIKSVDKSKSICTIFTNGEYLNKEVVEKLKDSGVFGIFVSLDYSDSKKHNEHRGRKGLFEKAVKGIKLCQKNGILTGLSTFITKEKIIDGELDAMMDLGKSLDVLEVFLFDVIATGKLKDKQSCMLGDNEINEIKRFRKKYNEKSDYPRIIHQTMFSSIAYPCAAEGCPAGVAQIHLRANGDVSPCDFTPLSFGNIRQKSLGEIWKVITESDIYSKPSNQCRLADSKIWDKIRELSSYA